MSKFKIKKEVREQWLQKILDPSNNCYNLRAFVYNIFGAVLESNQIHALRDMLDPKIRRIYISMARQSGKTFIIGLFQAMVPIFCDNVNCYVFDPKKEQAELIFEKFSNFVHFNPVNAFQSAIIVDKADRIKFSNSVENRAITASRNAEIEGLTAHIIILDESQAISPYKVRESIIPMGGGVERGAKIIQVGVPGITGSHFHKAYKNIYDKKNNPMGYVHHIYPWYKCPRLIRNKDYILAQKNDDPEAFARNYELKWQASNFGLFMSEEVFESCLEAFDWESIVTNPNIPLYMGVDFAKLRDSTVITLGYLDEKTKKIYIIYWYELRGTDYNTQAGFRTINANNKLSFAIIYVF